ncbi:hypothetical protein K0M31_012180 [Melipona bicolor]|uniref:Uncharacterized protein n=1 Tax=Melipona bicolor TaxID=60889 RepID=A0AA40FKH4_9HYME|nr:hypothetical protein K0M31_012180 [Melipona bicolor]
MASPPFFVSASTRRQSWLLVDSDGSGSDEYETFRQEGNQCDVYGGAAREQQHSRLHIQRRFDNRGGRYEKSGVESSGRNTTATFDIARGCRVELLQHSSSISRRHVRTPGQDEKPDIEFPAVNRQLAGTSGS